MIIMLIILALIAYYIFKQAVYVVGVVLGIILSLIILLIIRRKKRQ